MTRRDATRARGGVLLALVVVALVAAAGAGRASAAEAVAPWQAFDALDGALFDAELAATTNDADALAVAGRRAAVAAGELADGFDPSARASAARLRRAADGVVSERNGVDLAVTAATARATALSGAYETILAATRAGDLDTARAWLLVREFKPVTRFSHPSAASSVAIASLADGVIPRARAVRSIRSDLLDTYEALLRTSLSDTEDALRAGFPEKAAGSAATARGYWWILREAFVGQRGEAAAVRLDSAFDGLVGAARSGRPAATAGAAAAVVDDLLSFRAAPLTRSEQVRRAGQLIRYLGLVPVEYGRGVADGTVVVPIEIQEAITFRDGAAIAFGDLQSYLAGRDLAATRSGSARARRADARLGDAERGDGRSPTLPRSSDLRGRATAAARRRLSRRLEGGHGRGRLRRHRHALASVRRSRPPAISGAQSQSRLEAYATFELGPEQRLRGLAPSLFQRVEGLFWYGDGDVDGLVQLLQRNASAERSQRRWRRSTSRSRKPTRHRARAGLPQLDRHEQRDHRLPRRSRGGAHPRRADGEHGRRAAPVPEAAARGGRHSRSSRASSPGSSRRPCSARWPAGVSGSRRSSRWSRSASCS